MLLTRSPLSPGPKAWFSLDLHVLSAPPAFVLSQDQTLREDWFASEEAIFSSSLCSKVTSRSNQDVTGLKPLAPGLHECNQAPRGLDVSRC